MIYAYMHIVILGILAVASAAGAVAFFVSAFSDEQASPLSLLGGIVLGVLGFLLFAWWFWSANEPWRPELRTAHELKEVVYPDGSRVQMFTVDGAQHNATHIFRKFVDEKEWHVCRIRWSPVYKGVSWSGFCG